MGEVHRTEAALPWSKRVGGGYPTMEDLELAARLLDFDVLVGQQHVIYGYFMTIHPTQPSWSIPYRDPEPNQESEPKGEDNGK